MGRYEQYQLHIYVMKKIWLCLIIIGLLSFSTAAAEDDDLIQKVQNPLLLMEVRKQAMDSLMEEKDERILPLLSTLLKNPKEPIGLRSYSVDLMGRSSDRWAEMELINMVRDKSVNPESRNLALHAIWQKNPAKTLNQLVQIAQDTQDKMEVRTAALSYLRKADGKKLPPQFWQRLYQTTNPGPIRIAALNGMEEGALIETEKQNVLQTVRNLHETPAVRKHGILMIERNYSKAETETELLSILLNPKEPAEIRHFSLDHIKEYLTDTSLPQLQQAQTQERDPVFMKEIKTLIDQLQTN